MTNLYRTRKQAMQGCLAEARTAKRFAESAHRFAKNGQTTAAWNMADTATMAAKCAQIAHDSLRELAKGELTAEEFDAFVAAEKAVTIARQASEACANAVKRA